jgi:glycosyltransferase involved in cell wall biosynthesis
MMKKYSAKQVVQISLASVGVLMRVVVRYPLGRILYAMRNLWPRRMSHGPTPLLLYSQVIWQEVWQRPQECALRLSKYRPVIFFSPVPVHRRVDTLSRWQRRMHVQTSHGVTVETPLTLPGEYKSPLIFHLNRALILTEIRLILLRTGTVVFATNSPFVDYLVKRLDFTKIVYDVIDEFIAFSWAPPGSSQMERYILEHADIVFTGTHTLYEKKKSQHSNIHFIPCGVDFQLFQNNSTVPVPADIRSVPKPIAGYIGTLSERIDLELIERLAQRYPDLSIVFVGPIHGKLGNAPRRPNIYYLGLKPHEEIPAYVRHFDLALMPFRLTEAARSINPVKTLEYLAAGKVVISTAIPDVERFYGNVVRIARSHDEFISLVGQYLQRDNAALINHGIGMARKQSWDAMAEQMETLIAHHVPQR